MFSNILNSPIILFCSERSGSNLIAKIFDSHSEVSAPGVSHLFRFAHLYKISKESQLDELKKIIIEIFQAKVGFWELDNYDNNYLLNILSETINTNQMAAKFYFQEAFLSGKKYSLIKENSAYEYWENIRNVSKNCRFLFCVRDPRDMAVSWINGPVMRGGVLKAVDVWGNDQKGFLRVFNKLKNDYKCAFIRYEDILKDPKKAISKVCNSLQLEFENNMLNFNIHSKSSKVDSTRSSMWSNLQKPILKDNSNKFKEHLNKNQILYIESLLFNMMKEFDYKLTLKPIDISKDQKEIDKLFSILSLEEPHEKESYYLLPKEERNAFENWSNLWKSNLGI